jgi:Rod binding domain-containing protein
VNIPGLLAITRDAAAVGPTTSAPGGAAGHGPVTEQFEALVLTQLLKSMRKTVPASDEPNAAREMYHELHDEMLAAHLAKHGGIGLAAILRAYLDRAPGTGGTK